MTTHRRPTVLAAAALAVAAVLAPLTGARGEPPPGPLAGEADEAAALALEARVADHFHHGQIYEQHYGTPDRVEGDVAALVGRDDSALYTGNYLAAQSFRYALAGHHAAAATDDGERAFWEQQRDEAKSRVDAMVDQFHLLANISSAWKTTLDPQVHTEKAPTDNGFVDFGGGVFQGEPGLLMRSCMPNDAPAPLPDDPDHNRVVELTYQGTTYRCRHATSRDAYAGTTFGLATALDLVGPDDPALRSTVAGDLMLLTDFVLRHPWTTPRPHGRVVTTGNDLDNFISPLFVYVPLARLNMAQVARHAAHVAGSAADQARWDAAWAEELAWSAPQLAGSMEIDAADPHSAYYKFHLHHMAIFDVIRLEADGPTRELFRQALATMDATTGDDGNALYDAIVYALSGDAGRLASAVQREREWLDYRARLDDNGNVTLNSPRCGGDLTCVPRDQVDQVVDLGVGPEVVATRPGTAAERRSATPLAVADRRAADFLWQKDPTLLDGSPGATWESPSADFLLPYWMVRYYTEVAVPPAQPLPPAPVPSFR